MTSIDASLDKHIVVLHVTSTLADLCVRPLAPLLRLVLELRDSGVHHLGIDLSSAALDPTGVGCLASLDMICRSAGGALYVCNTSLDDAFYYRAFKAAGLRRQYWDTYDNASLQLERHEIVLEKIGLFLDRYDQHLAGLGHLLDDHGRSRHAHESLGRVCEAIATSFDRYLATHPVAPYDLQSGLSADLLQDTLIQSGWETHLVVAPTDSACNLSAIIHRETDSVTAAIVECRRLDPKARWRLGSKSRVSVDIIHDLFAANPVPRAPQTVFAMTSDSAGAYDCKASQYNLSSRDFGQLTDWINEFKPHPDGRCPVRVTRQARPHRESTASTDGA